MPENFEGESEHKAAIDREWDRVARKKEQIQEWRAWIENETERLRELEEFKKVPFLIYVLKEFFILSYSFPSNPYTCVQVVTEEELRHLTMVKTRKEQQQRDAVVEAERRAKLEKERKALEAECARLAEQKEIALTNVSSEHRQIEKWREWVKQQKQEIKAQVGFRLSPARYHLTMHCQPSTVDGLLLLNWNHPLPLFQWDTLKPLWTVLSPDSVPSEAPEGVTMPPPPAEEMGGEAAGEAGERAMAQAPAQKLEGPADEENQVFKGVICDRISVNYIGELPPSHR